MSTSTTDVSTSLLSQLFGGDFSQLVATITGAGSGVATDAGAGMIQTMAGVINGFALVATGLVVLYMWAISVAQTAHEGEVGGKSFNSMWAPIRTVAAVVFVSPFPGLGGFSLLQAIIISMVSVSINGANTLFQAELKFFTDNNYSVFSGTSAATGGIDDLATSILESETCMHFVNTKQTAYKVQIQKRTLLGNSYGYDWASSMLSGDLIHSMSCGRVVVDCSKVSNAADSSAEAALSQAVCTARGHAVVALADALDPIAANIVSGNVPSADDYQNAINTYWSTWKNGVANTKNAQAQAQVQALDSFVHQAGLEGWVSAGQWYWTISSTSLANQAAGEVTPTTAGPTWQQLPDYKESWLPVQSLLDKFLNAVPGATADASGATTAADAPGGSKNGSNGDQMGKLVTKIFGNSLGSGANALQNLLTEKNDPIRSLSGYGQWMITAGWSIMGTLTAASAAAYATGQSVLTNTWGGGFGMGAVMALTPAVNVVAGVLIGEGGLLAYYLPAIPFVFWSFAVLGWLIMVSESLIAAPLWASSHAVSDGEGFAGRYALQGWQLFVNVIFRPILLTFGLMISMFLMHAITAFTLKGFQISNLSIITSTSMTSITGWIFSNLIMIGLVVALSHKAHEIIYESADNVMKWMGFGVAPLGATKASHDVTSAATGAAATVKGVTGEAGRAQIAQGRASVRHDLQEDGERPNTNSSVSGGSDIQTPHDK